MRDVHHKMFITENLFFGKYYAFFEFLFKSKGIAAYLFQTNLLEGPIKTALAFKLKFIIKYIGAKDSASLIFIALNNFHQGE